ncbi:hypothetical protein ACH4E8_10615 [Streptomyces sp. NPDC017979]|uniref:hypothetical protein n=1 Tax=Streptomyces sp. NPDC017979 TaxID=3365024 RepID=UPI0037A96D93
MTRARPGDLSRGNDGVPRLRGLAGGERSAALDAAAATVTARSAARARSERPLTSVDASGGGPRDDRCDEGGAGGGDEGSQSKLWHITLSVSGAKAPLTEVRRGLEQLAHDHPFLLTSRYANDHAEIRYWEEARDLHDAAAVALRLWGEHRSSAKLPPWTIVGLEVIDRQTYHQRIAEGYGPPPASPVGIHPF